MKYNDDTVAAAKFLSGFLHTVPEITTAGQKKTEDKAGTSDEDNGNPLLHHDKKVRKAIHKTLKTVHKHVFADNTKSLDDAKNKHAAIVAMTADDNDEDSDRK